MGLFTHEAVAVDPKRQQLLMTEDQPDGGFYRFKPDRYEDLGVGTLEIASVADIEAVIAGDISQVTWLPVPDPTASQEFTRRQVAASTNFLGGEGIWYQDDVAYFSTKFDNRIWSYQAADEALCLLYDAGRDGGLLTGVDNVTIGLGGEVLVAEDGGDMEIIVLAPGSSPCELVSVIPLIQITGQENSEVTGPVFDQSGTRLYFSSQRGTTGDFLNGGITYEVSGPFVV